MEKEAYFRGPWVRADALEMRADLGPAGSRMISTNRGSVMGKCNERRKKYPQYQSDLQRMRSSESSQVIK